MKRSRSGSRSGVKKPATTTKFRYELVRYNEHGELFDLNEQELAAFKSKHPQFASQYLEKPPEETEVTWQSQCGRMLESLMQTKAAAWFLTPVNPAQLGLNDYFTVIKNPMDLGTVKTRLLGGYYQNPEDFAEAVNLTFANAMTYNPLGTMVHADAAKSLDKFEKSYASMVKRLQQAAGASASAPALPPMPKLLAPRPAVVAAAAPSPPVSHRPAVAAAAAAAKAVAAAAAKVGASPGLAPLRSTLPPAPALAPLVATAPAEANPLGPTDEEAAFLAADDPPEPEPEPAWAPVSRAPSKAVMMGGDSEDDDDDDDGAAATASASEPNGNGSTSASDAGKGPSAAGGKSAGKSAAAADGDGDGDEEEDEDEEQEGAFGGKGPSSTGGKGPVTGGKAPLTGGKEPADADGAERPSVGGKQQQGGKYPQGDGDSASEQADDDVSESDLWGEDDDGEGAPRARPRARAPTHALRPLPDGRGTIVWLRPRSAAPSYPPPLPPHLLTPSRRPVPVSCWCWSRGRRPRVVRDGRGRHDVGERRRVVSLRRRLLLYAR